MPTLVGFDKNVTKRYTCYKCGAINEVFPKEIRNLRTGKDYSGGSDGADGFNCASCGEEIVVRAW